MSEHANRSDLSAEAQRAKADTPSTDRLTSLWRRIKEHRIAQWSVAYVALAYAIQHGVVLTSDAFVWPHAVPQISMLLLVLGLPVVMVCAWYHGEQASRRISGPELTMIAILLAIGSLFFYLLVKPVEQLASRAPATQAASVTAARQAAASPKGAISVAVLPFLNLSPDKDQEFFSDGMTEEITAALAKVPDLRVVARTSAFEFKGKNVDIENIGQQLHATHLIEGSVRKAGNRLRITAQLIKADDGTHIWAEDYDRELTDVFAVQEDIARAITASLHMTLGLKPGENLIDNRGIDTASYEQYLRASAVVLARNGETTPAQEIRNLTQAASLLENVVARNPAYAPAWWRLAVAYFNLANDYANQGDAAETRPRVEELRAKTEAVGNRAAELDPDSPTRYAAFGWLLRSRGRQVEGDELLDKALQLDPLSATVLYDKEMSTAAAGHLKESLEFAEKAYALDPFFPNLARDTADRRWLNGKIDDAIALAKTLRPNDRGMRLALIYASTGRFSDAADALMELAAGNPDSDAAQAARLLRNGPVKIAADKPPHMRPGLVMLYLYLGAPDRALERYQRMADLGYLYAGLGNIWHPDYAPVRKTERFKTVMRKLGFVDYWRAKGWPPQCHPVGTDDFACA